MTNDIRVHVATLKYLANIKDENMEEKGLRYNEGKLQWSLVDFNSLEPLVRVLEYGKNKYGKDNWKKGLDPTQTLESLSRHLFSLMAGEELDKESNLPHIGHILANAMMYYYSNELVKNGTR